MNRNMIVRREGREVKFLPQKLALVFGHVICKLHLRPNKTRRPPVVSGANEAGMHTNYCILSAPTTVDLQSPEARLTPGRLLLTIHRPP